MRTRARAASRHVPRAILKQDTRHKAFSYKQRGMTMAEKFEAWGIVELMGHQRVAGRLSEQPLGGGNLLRVDIPNGEGFRTAFYGASSIYAVHITDEPAARKIAENSGTRP